MNALILVDIQNDFLPGGALAVRDGDLIVPIANELMAKFDLVVATKDWHPADHLSFASSHPGHSVGDVIELEGLPQVLWPDHCVEGSGGAEFPCELESDQIDRIFEKGTDRRIDSYSGFFDNDRRNATGLGVYLTQKGVTGLFVMGLATDYCVKFTALDAANLGFKTHLILDGCRGVELQTGDIDGAIEEMKAAGVTITTSADVAAGA